MNIPLEHYGSRVDRAFKPARRRATYRGQRRRRILLRGRSPDLVDVLMVFGGLEGLRTVHVVDDLSSVHFVDGEDFEQEVSDELGREGFAFEPVRKLCVWVAIQVMVQNEFPQRAGFCRRFLHTLN
jgi:hypothetical protein